MPYLKARTHHFRWLKRALLVVWGFLVIISVVQALLRSNMKILLLIPLPFLIAMALWFSFYFLIVLHEVGHWVVGWILGFPVNGLEIGQFPYATLKLRKITLRIGKFPRGGRTLLRFTPRSFTRWRQFCFLAGGSGFELLFFITLFYLSRGNRWVEVPLLLFYLDQLWVNLIPKYEEGRPDNDGSLMLELLFPKKAIKDGLRSFGGEY